MKLLVMIPAYNEAENIERVVDNLIRNYPQYDYVIINDGSTDDTRKVCARRKYNMLDLPVEEMIEEMACTDCDIVIGSRFKTERKPVSARMIGSQIITVAIWMTTGGHYIGDVTSGMRLFNKKMIKRFGYDMHYSPEPDTLAYLLNCNVKIREIQVEMHERIAGVSYLDFKGSIWYMMKMLFSIFLFQWVRRRVKE